jgi:transglutaminase-like putative cysteine protease
VNSPIAPDIAKGGFQLSRFFNARVEESWRLRVLGLAFLWLAVLALVWTGGSPWLGLVGALGTLGHWLSWCWRHHASKGRSLLIALLVIALSFAMRSQVLEALEGDWLPVARFLLIVQALSSFDLRTRGGLYTGMALGGTVLFFASQQSFDPSFGFVVMGFMVVLLSFLTIAFLEDGTKDAQVHWSKHWLGRPAMWPYWIAVACAVFALSGLAFWLMPRAGDGPIGPAQASIMPYFGNSPPDLPPTDDPAAQDLLPSQPTGNNRGPLPLREPGIPTNQPDTSTVAQTATLRAGAGPMGGRAKIITTLQDTVQDLASGGLPRVVPYDTAIDVGRSDRVVFLVRSRVTSYWRGWTLEDFDGRFWSGAGPSDYLAPSSSRDGVWYNQETSAGQARLRYNQTFFVLQDQPGAVFMGYQGLRIVDNGGDMDGSGVRKGDSYQVLSGYPKHTAEGLGRDHALATNAQLTWLPSNLKPEAGRLSERITNDAASDFERAQRIVGYVSKEREFDPGIPIRITGPVDIESFLSDGGAGNAMYFATATVVLARASGLSSRLAVGYRPGFRDPLSGAMVVRESDFHAWAEVFFVDHGWVPFDSTPPPDQSMAGGGVSPVGKLFQRSAGGQVSDMVMAVPSRLSDTLSRLAKNPLLLGLLPVLGAISMMVRWSLLRASRGAGAGGLPAPDYHQLPGQSRRDFLKLYRRVERLVRRRTGQRRMPWQTAESYAEQASTGNTKLSGQLRWFTRTMWRAAYDPGDMPDGLMTEARARMTPLKTALRDSSNGMAARRNIPH